MRKASVWVAVAVLLCTTAVAVNAAKVDELDRPADYSHDSQVPSRPGSPHAILFSENFDAGIPGTWSVVDNESTGVVWTNLAGCGESGNFTNGSGDVACVSSDVFGTAEFDTELVTPSLNFCEAQNVALLAALNYQNFANLDFLEVDISTDGGSNWTNLLSWNEDHGSFRATPGEDINLDLTAYGGLPNVLLRFHYFDPNTSDFDWYAQVDNFVLDGDGAISTPGAAECQGPNVIEVPTLGKGGIALLGFLLAATALLVLRRRQA